MPHLGNAKMIEEIEAVIGSHGVAPEPMRWATAGVECRRERQRYANDDYAWSIEVISVTRERPGPRFHLLLVTEFWRAGQVDLRSQKWLKLLAGQPDDLRNWIAAKRS